MIALGVLLCIPLKSMSQNNAALTTTPKSTTVSTYWQQQADYTMVIDMNVDDYTYKGTQTIVYTNNSPDTLNKVFYHLYFNAFQPGSEMDVRSQSIADPDRRVKSRISQLKPNEIGFINVSALKQNGKALKYETVGTVLEVALNKPILPHETATFEMVFNAQVPLQIRRSGRDSDEGVALSMAQWYPKLAEYDKEGWHADPYIGREFYGVWGNFDVTINIDKSYIVAGSGYLQNPNQIGYGYETGKVKRPPGKKLSWHFIAPNVHDFTWAADPDYIHDTYQIESGPMLHFFYKKNLEPKYLENWKKLPEKTAQLMAFFNERIGPYPYKQYSVIQAGDGGMEYAMCTLITGQRNYFSLVDVTSHELAHSWFQFLLATNEVKHEWMDEGFTSYISDEAVNIIMNQNQENPHLGAYKRFVKLDSTGLREPLTTHADRYHTNISYSISAYSTGALFLTQLKYIIGETHFNNTLKRYYNEWAFKHPTPNDFIRVAEKESGLELHWFLIDFTQTTNAIDYAVKSIEGTTVVLERIGKMPMPIELAVTYTDGSTEDFYIPLQMMRGEKPTQATTLKDWAWAYPTYSFTTQKKIKNVTIDPKNTLLDVNRTNNSLSLKEN